MSNVIRNGRMIWRLHVEDVSPLKQRVTSDQNRKSAIANLLR